MLSKFRGFFARSALVEDITAPNKVPYLDGIRAFAVIMVFCAHSFSYYKSTLAPLRKYVDAQVGVDMFFVLSAYLLTSGFLSYPKPFSAVYLKAYAKRRAARVLPLFYTILALFFVGVGYHNYYVTKQPLTMSALIDVVKLATFTNNLGLDRGRPELTFDGPMWSMSPEIHFYFILPVLLYFVLNTGNYRSREVYLKRFALVAAIWLSVIFLLHSVAENPDLRLTIFDRFYVFVFGAIAAIITKFWRIEIRNRLLLETIVIVLLASLYTKQQIYPNMLANANMFSFLYYTIDGLLISALIVLIDQNSCFLKTFLSLRIFRYISKISFSVYLLHVPILITIYSTLNPKGVAAEALSFCVTLGCIIVLSHWTYVVIERPMIMRAKQ